MHYGWGLYPLPALSLTTSQTAEIVNGVPSQLRGCLLVSLTRAIEVGMLQTCVEPHFKVSMSLINVLLPFYVQSGKYFFSDN